MKLRIQAIIASLLMSTMAFNLIPPNLAHSAAQPKLHWSRRIAEKNRLDLPINVMGDIVIDGMDRIISTGRMTSPAILDLEGNTLWEYKPRELYHSVCYSALSDDDWIFVCTSDYTLDAFDGQHKLQWSVDFPGREDGMHFCSCSITENGEIVVVAKGGNIYCYRPDGTLHWKSNIADVNSFWPPVQAPNGTLYFRASEFQLIAFSPEGEELWRTRAEAHTMREIHVTSDSDVMYLTGDNSVAYISSSGSHIWETQLPGEFDVLSEPQFSNADQLYVLTEDSQGLLVLNRIDSDGSLSLEQSLGRSSYAHVNTLPNGQLLVIQAAENPLRNTDFEDFGQAHLTRQQFDCYVLDPTGEAEYQWQMGQGSYYLPLRDAGSTRLYLLSLSGTLYCYDLD